jgi:hypothetical protein
MSLRAGLLCLLFLLFAACNPGTPQRRFLQFVAAVESGDAAKAFELDYELASRAKPLFKTDREHAVKALADSFSMPATSACLENGFEVRSCAYAARAYFTPDCKAAVTDAVEREKDVVALKVVVDYSEASAPYYVTGVEVVWDEPRSYQGGLYIPPIKPIPAFEPGFFAHDHPFRRGPRFHARYTTYDLALEIQNVRQGTFDVAMVRTPEMKRWQVAGIRPLPDQCQFYADSSAGDYRPWR